MQYVRHEDLSSDEQVLAWLKKLSAKYRLQRRGKLHNVHKYTSPGNFWNVSKEDRVRGGELMSHAAEQEPEPTVQGPPAVAVTLRP